jgi:SPP1 gp7 family putative phage head morphogenesis protein
MAVPTGEFDYTLVSKAAWLAPEFANVAGWFDPDYLPNPIGTLAGTLTATTSQAGTLAGAGSLAGASAATTSQTGALVGSGALAGSSEATTSQQGAIEAMLGGTSEAIASQTGQPTGTSASQATSEAQTSQTGTLIGSGQASGSSEATAGSTAHLTTGTTAASGATTGQQGAVTGAGNLAATSEATAGSGATLLATGALAATQQAVAGQTGTVLGAGALAATSEAQAGSTATIGGALPASGTLSASTGQAGTLLGSGALAGSSEAIAGQAGTVLATGALAATAEATAGAVVTIGASGALAGTSEVVAGQQGSPTLPGISGGSEAVAGQSTTLTGVDAAIGTSTATATASGTVLASGALAAESDATASQTLSIVGAGVLAGESDSTASGSATLAGLGILAGGSEAVANATGIAQPNILGASEVVAGASGALTGAGTLAGESDAIAGSTADLTPGQINTGASAQDTSGGGLPTEIARKRRRWRTAAERAQEDDRAAAATTAAAMAARAKVRLDIEVVSGRFGAPTASANANVFASVRVDAWVHWAGLGESRLDAALPRDVMRARAPELAGEARLAAAPFATVEQDVPIPTAAADGLTVARAEASGAPKPSLGQDIAAQSRALLDDIESTPSSPRGIVEPIASREPRLEARIRRLEGDLVAACAAVDVLTTSRDAALQRVREPDSRPIRIVDLPTYDDGDLPEYRDADDEPLSSVQLSSVQRHDPVHAVQRGGRTVGYQWGKTGKLYRTVAAANRQAAAIYARGWKEDAAARQRKSAIHQALQPHRFAELGYKQALVGLVRGVHRSIEQLCDREILPAGVTRHGGGARLDADETPADRAKRILTPRLREKVARHLGNRIVPHFDTMAQKVTKKNDQAQALIGIPITHATARVADAVGKARLANIRLIEDAGRDYVDDVYDVLQDPDNEGIRVEELAQKIYDRGNVSKSRAELIAVDQTLKLNSAITRARHEAVGITSYRWSTSRDERVRPMHADLEGQTFDYDDPPVTNDDGDTNNPGGDYRCLPGNAKITFTGPIRRAYRRWYRGQLTTLVTDSGEPLECTPNHPVLTASGWKPAERVEVGDHIFEVRHHRFGFSKADIQDRHTSIAEIFETLLLLWKPRRDAGVASQFHGDGCIDQEVEIVDVDGPLLFDGEIARAKRFGELLFTLADEPSSRSRELEAALVWLGLPANRIVGRLGQRLAILERHLFESQNIGLRTASKAYSRSLQEIENCLTRDPVLFRESQNGHTAIDIELQAFVLREVFRVERGTIMSSDRDTPSADRLGQVVGVDLKTPRDVCKTFSVLHRPARVVQKCTRVFESHVFNLETIDGWYGSNYAVKNCRCVAIPVIAEFEQEPEESAAE